MSEAPGGAAIRCEGLSRSYGALQALKNLTLSVPYGSIFGFLGRNGAGKTTTLRILAGLARPSAGAAWVAGVNVARSDGLARRSFGYLPQDPAFYKWMTPREYLDYAAALFAIPTAERRRRVDEMLALAGLRGAARRKIGGFSGGMIQRLGIAQALIHNPPVLLLDEPTSALDPAGRYETLELIAALRGRVTVFFSTHILSDVERVCDRVAILNQGELLLEAGRAELLNRYAVNAAELELEDPAADADDWIAALRAQAWVAGVERRQNVIRVTVSDMAAGRAALLPLAASSGLALRRVEWVRPSLEEIFLKLSA